MYIHAGHSYWVNGCGRPDDVRQMSCVFLWVVAYIKANMK